MNLIIDGTPEELATLLVNLTESGMWKWEPPDQYEIIRQLAKKGYIIAKDDTRLKN